MEIFTVTGHSLLSPGYTSILTWQALGNSDTLPKFTSDEKVNIQEVKDIFIILYLFTCLFIALFGCIFKKKICSNSSVMFCFIVIGKINRMLYTTTRLFNRGRINISHGKTRHRNRRFDSCTYK